MGGKPIDADPVRDRGRLVGRVRTHRVAPAKGRPGLVRRSVNARAQIVTAYSLALARLRLVVS